MGNLRGLLLCGCAAVSAAAPRPDLAIGDTTAEFRIERDYISFRIAGEREPASDLGVELLLGGKVVRGASATHPRTIPEVPNHSIRDSTLYWRTWDVRGLAGNRVRLRLNRRSRHGAMTAQGFVQTDQPRSVPTDATRLYDETFRPQFHYTPRAYWLSDANGLLYYKGTWHLFHQHRRPEHPGVVWAHAVSPDLVHWREQAPAIVPPGEDNAYSGSGWVDAENASGMQRGPDPPLLLFYTVHPPGGALPKPGDRKHVQSMAVSTDGGRSFRLFEGNPILRTPDYRDRDPKVFYYPPKGAWYMILSLSVNNSEREKATYGLFRSRNLRDWDLLQRIGPGAWYWECPDFFELGGKWFLVKGNGEYIAGRFDGDSFHPETAIIRNRWGGNYYATQTFENAPNGRRVQIGWMNTGKPAWPDSFPGMPFNQQMSVPRELTYRASPEGPRLTRYPAREMESLRGPARSWTNLTLEATGNPLSGVRHDLLDLDMVIEPRSASAIVLNLRGAEIVYDAAEQTLNAFNVSAPLPLKDGRFCLRALLDRASVELFGNVGEMDLSGIFFPDPANRTVSLTTRGGSARGANLHIWGMRSVYSATEAAQ
jgi:fructan beta-fructosidase